MHGAFGMPRMWELGSKDWGEAYGNGGGTGVVGGSIIVGTSLCCSFSNRSPPTIHFSKALTKFKLPVAVACLVVPA